MAIGVFDSGVGGLTIHHALVHALPDADFIYLADQANTPYGGRRGEEIVALTRAGCERLFAEGANLVILACNTAAAVALRRLQQSWLPDHRRRLGRAVNILGIIVPTIEAATGRPWDHAVDQRPAHDKIERVRTLAVFSTPATAASRVFEIEIDKRGPEIAVFCEPCPELARLIEAEAPEEVLRGVIAGHVAAAMARIGKAPDQAVLGCTHYEIVAPLFRAALPDSTTLIHQPDETAAAVLAYLARKPDYDPGASGARRFLTTGRAGARNGLVERFWGAPVHFESV